MCRGRNPLRAGEECVFCCWQEHSLSSARTIEPAAPHWWHSPSSQRSYLWSFTGDSFPDLASPTSLLSSAFICSMCLCALMLAAFGFQLWYHPVRLILFSLPNVPYLLRWFALKCVLFSVNPPLFLICFLVLKCPGSLCWQQMFVSLKKMSLT